ncbi:hypothetical protein KYC5002_42245 [Archangium violaceum]|uniref:jacalin-like lectin n=1 Tax=Archangium violaceum TaxID=83451 RepID=UPI002B2872CE|nr:hypothetical protein KYC5002_42245 [Archangium gephyra]
MTTTTDGCWVQFYDGENESDGTLRFDGPVNVADMNDYIFSTGEKGGDEPDSLMMGSRAWIQVFTKDDYGGSEAFFYPNQKIDSLDDFGVGGKIDSFKLFDSQPSWFPPPSTVNWAVESSNGIVSSLSINNFFRTALGTALMLVPKVGGALKTLAYGLWPDPRTNKEQAWASFQNYISQVVGTIYQQIITTGLSDKLSGLYNLTIAYADAPPERRQSTFAALLADLQVQEPFFVNLSSARNTLSFFLPFGSLMLITMREQILFYQDIYGVPLDPQERQTLVDALQAKIDAYQSAVNTARSQLLSQRAAMVTILDESSITSDMWVPIDTYSGWRGTQEFGGGSKDRAQQAANEHAESETNALAYSLDQNIAQTQLWSWMNPDNTTPIQAPSLIYLDGPYGSYQSSTAFSAVAGTGSSITRVVVMAGSLIDSLEVFIDGVSTGRNGGSGGAPNTLDLASGETIVRANGYSSGLINELGFTSSTGRSFLAGSLNGTNGTTGTFTSEAPAGTANGRLVGMSGYSVNGTSASSNLKVLTFHWYCTLPLPENPEQALGTLEGGGQPVRTKVA